MKNIRRLYAPLGYMVLVFLLFSISEALCRRWVKLELLGSYDNTPYRKEAVMFILSTSGAEFVDLTEAAQCNILSGCAILRYDDESYGTNEVIYCDQDVIGIEGMEALNFLSGEKLAVAGVGSGVSIGDTIMENGVVYPVKGILEEHISAAINTGVFYSRCDISHISAQEVYVLTAKEERRIAGAYAALEELLRNQGVEIRSREMSKARFSNFIGYHEVTVFLFGVLGAFYVGLLCLFAHIWLRIKGAEIYVLNLLGYIPIKRKVLAEYSAIWLFAFLLSLGAFFATSFGSYCGVEPVLGISAGLLFAALLCGYLFCRACIKD